VRNDELTYLLDTCIWSYWFNPNSPEHSCIENHVAKLADKSVLGISIITWGEIFYGHRVESRYDKPVQLEYVQFVKSKNPKIFFVDIHTATKYGELRARLFEKIPKKKRRKLRPEQVIDPISSRELGMQENDLWMAAQAITRNLKLVTNDKLGRIRSITSNELSLDNWAAS